MKLKIEEHRLLNWVLLLQLDYTNEHLDLNHLSRGKILDIFYQQHTLLASFGRLDKSYNRLEKPLLQEQTEICEIVSDRLSENGGSIPEFGHQVV